MSLTRSHYHYHFRVQIHKYHCTSIHPINSQPILIQITNKMSNTASDSGMRVYYDFGGLPERIFTRASYLEVLAQFKAFQDPDQGVATLKTVFGDTITMTRGPPSTTEGEEGSYMVTYEHTKLGTAQVKVLPKDDFFIEANSIFQIAKQNVFKREPNSYLPGGCSDYDWNMIEAMTQRCAFPIHFFEYQTDRDQHGVPPSKEQIDEHTKAWETSQLKKDLVQALERNANQIRQVDRIVCYGLGSLGRYTGARCYFQHLAACTIAKTLSKAQATNREDSKTIEIFAQDLFYTDHAREYMAKLDPPITPVDYRINEALMKVNRNTFIVCIGAESDIVESALDITYPDGPAGLLCDKMHFDGQTRFDRKKFSTAEGRSPSTYGKASASEWNYKQRCVREEVTDDENFGMKPRTEMEKIGKVMRNSEGEFQRDEAGNVIWTTNDVYRLDENDRPIMFKPDTELLLRKK
jgi:hypothetical protein